MERLKTASYEMRFLGELHDWKTTDDGSLGPRCRRISCGGAVELPRNSITYFWMKEKLLLPEYIAARFNLHIRHVHKGILLGTGPLIDPEFFGNLLIPLHNLTDNDYKLDGGEGIIWVEFTKLSGHIFWNKQEEKENPHDLKSFPDLKYISTPEGYFEKSGIHSKGRARSGVQSAFKGELEKAQNATESAIKETENFRKYYTWGGIVGAIAIIVALAAVIIEGYSLVTQVIKMTDDVRHQVRFDRDKQSQKIDFVKDNIADLETRIDRYENEVSELKKQIDS